MVNPEGPSSLPLPRWVYVPGEDAEADHATLAQAKALVPARFEGFVPASHPALRYGLELNDAGFFWECHEILEAVWAAPPQGGARPDPAAGLHPECQHQSQAEAPAA